MEEAGKGEDTEDEDTVDGRRTRSLVRTIQSQTEGIESDGAVNNDRTDHDHVDMKGIA